MNERLVNLSVEKRELLRKLLAGQGEKATRIPRSARRPILRASYGQERLWFLDRLNPGAPVYQISTAQLMDGELHRETLEKSLNALVRRHESLRTTFALLEGKVMQVIADTLDLRLDYVDLSASPEAARIAAAKRIGGEDARTPFNLSTGPLLRAVLLRLAPQSHVLVLTLHHIIADGWSLDVLTRELSSLYEAYWNGEVSRLPALPIQYADYSVWQRERFTPERLGVDLAYWRCELDGVTHLELPTDYPTRVRSSTCGARVFFRLGSEETDKLKCLARSCDATVFMLLLASFQILLSRYSGQSDIVVGSPVSGRNHPETEGLIGLVLNTICLRTHIDPTLTFRHLLEQVRVTALGAYAHQDLPFEKLVEELAPQRNGGTDALFNVMFVLQPGPRRGSDDDDPMEWQLESETAKFDITLSVLETARGLVGAIEYRTDLFKRTRIERMAGHLVQLLREISQNPAAKINDLEILTDKERDLFHRWNATDAPFPDDVCVHELIAQQARRTPDAVAVRCGELCLTYSELEIRANQVAADLAAQGCSPEEPIGVLMSRSAELLPVLIGIWKAGCAYVPLDPETPAERTDLIVKDARLKIIITCPIALDRAEAITSASGSQRLAYVIYTSGSTGTPKGVMVEHRSVVNYLTWVNQKLLASAPQLIPSTTKITFDAALKQLFAPLLVGKAVWFIPEATIASPHDLLQTLGSADCDFTLNCVPWLWSVLLDEMQSDSAAAKHLKCLLLGGENVSQDLVDRTFARFPNLEVWNLYGPTEATANAIAARLYPGVPVSIGCPVANTKAFALDASGNQTPIGVPGELYIGGEALARGYWNRPELVAERFIHTRHGRLYKTGDLVRYMEDGTLEFLGRVDRQIKLRGYRIELGDIEFHLARHPAVLDSVVTLASGTSVAHLIAYIETRGSQARAADLRAFLRSALPDYMIPAQFVFVDSLPRTTHGKIHMAALPPIADDFVDETYLAPRNLDEQRLAEVWKDVLRVESPGVRTSFFALGGHSLLIIQAISRIRDLYGVELPIRSFFESPTIEELALVFGKLRAQDSALSSKPIPRVNRAWRRSTTDL